MNPMDRTEHTLDSIQVLNGGFLAVFRDTVRLPDGETAQREYIKHPGAVVVVAQRDDGRYIMERQFRYPMQRDMIEFPAGKIDAGEHHAACARRELREETGFDAAQWAYAGCTHNAIAYADEVIHIYFARQLRAGPRQLDAGEFIDVFDASLTELLAWTKAGAITDAKTLTCLLWLQNVAQGAWQLDWQSA